jgi:hypothetical protein
MHTVVQWHKDFIERTKSAMWHEMSELGQCYPYMKFDDVPVVTPLTTKSDSEGIMKAAATKNVQDQSKSEMAVDIEDEPILGDVEPENGAESDTCSTVNSDDVNLSVSRETISELEFKSRIYGHYHDEWERILAENDEFELKKEETLAIHEAKRLKREERFVKYKPVHAKAVSMSEVEEDAVSDIEVDGEEDVIETVACTEAEKEDLSMDSESEQANVTTDFDSESEKSEVPVRLLRRKGFSLVIPTRDDEDDGCTSESSFGDS